MEKIYLYGVLAGEVGVKPCEVNVNGGSIKIDSLTLGDISVVFSMVLPDFLSRCTRNEILDWIVRHQQVISYLYSRSKVIPFKVGATVGSIGELASLMQANGDFFLNILKAIKELDEWNVVIGFANLQRAVLMAGEETAVRMLKEQIRKKGCTTREDLIEVGQLIQKILTGWKKRVAGQFINEVKSITDCTFYNNQLDEGTLLSMAVLTTREGADKIAEILNSLPGDPDLSARMVGPMPPHSFYTLEIKGISEESLKNALNILGLAGIPHYRDIVEAKKSILHHVHPDKGTRHDGSQVQTVLDSFNLLDCYYRHKNFSVSKLEDAFMVRVANTRQYNGDE